MKRKSPLILAPALALVALSFFMGEEKSLAVLRDPLTVLQDRSPGERDAGALFQTKPERKPPPTERVLAMVRERPEIAPPAELPLAREPLVFDEPSLVPPLATIDDLALGQPIPALPILPPINHGSTVIPGGGIPGGVPEPSTWLMMILGLFSVGAAMRRNNRRRLTPSDSQISPTV